MIPRFENLPMINAVLFSIQKIRIYINFMHLQLKLTSELCVRKFRRRNNAKESQGAHFTNFFSKNLCIYRKKVNFNRFFILKINLFFKFYVFTIKSAFRNMLECSEIKFDISLNVHSELITDNSI